MIASPLLTLGPIAVDPDFARAFFYAEEFVAVIMNFLPPFITRLNCHKHKLKIVASVLGTAKIRIFIGELFNAGNKTLHA